MFMAAASVASQTMRLPQVLLHVIYSLVLEWVRGAGGGITSERPNSTHTLLSCCVLPSHDERKRQRPSDRLLAQKGR